MNEPITLPSPVMNLPPTPQSKWQREYQAFQRLLPQLLTKHRGQYVAIHNEQVADSGADKLTLALRVLAKIGNMPIHVGLVTEEAPRVARSGLRRDLGLGGDAP